MAIARFIFYSLLGAGLTACAYTVPKPPPPSPGHLRAEEKPTGEIPRISEQMPFLPPPKPLPPSERYTVVVNEVPVKELLFALARDASMNVDIDPSLEGIVTLNAIDQTLPQILDRIARQVELRYEIQDRNIIITPDKPYFRTYKIDYVNLSRESTGTISIATQIATTGTGAIAEGGVQVGGGAGNNNSTTAITNTSDHRFWQTLTQNILAIVGEQATGSATGLPVTNSVIPNPEAGVINVRATSKQHQDIQAFIDQVMANAQRQVLIEATVVEVTLNDQYQAGIDWSVIHRIGGRGAGFDVVQGIGPIPGANPTRRQLRDVTSFILQYLNPDSDGKRIQVLLNLLREFGDLKVLSSPKIMVLNNQTAVLKVVRNEVFFEIDVQPGFVSFGAASQPTVDTTAKTVPVGFIMTVTPQINENDQITLNVRPTISTIFNEVPDPNPELRRAGFNIVNLVPEIEVREMESVLKLSNGQVAVLGGLIQDSIRKGTSSVPLLSDLPILGDIVFKSRDNEYIKTELVIFLRPAVIRNPSLNADLGPYQPFLPDQPPATGPRSPSGGEGL
jgi:MSHA biogenesis protein MshL